MATYQDIFAYPIKYAPIRMIGIWDRGLEFWGVVVGIFGYLFYACKKDEENAWRWSDILSLAILTGIPFGHFGAYLEGLNFGRETNLPWGVTFESYTVPYTLPIHPAQMYALIYSLIITVTALYIFTRKPLRHDGDLTLGIAASYGILRFIEEFFRGDESLTLSGISLAYFLSLLSVVIAGILLLKRYNKLDFIHKNQS
jgi:phosphatidylglycerol:prolipoprotein diacylglycerol transferase